ncbi:MAG: EAL domain-containing protein [Azoarcus sp.]|jgi:EAL domain-containing protein (putative c-di-GMP-specific phosphodiesterase class I)/GGDEF domain-containing protein|nr:EAL domain-containing protein [Azoarcus sp.]
MSLIKQLWIAIVAITFVALGGSLAVGTLTARQYLEQQLNIKNQDNASVMATALTSQLLNDPDPVNLELQITAQFDVGHYRAIRLTAPDGAVIVDLRSDPRIDEVPEWFVRLTAIREQPGVAHVTDKWQQFGTLALESHTGYVYAALWHSIGQLLLWFLVTVAAAGCIGSLLLSRVTAPLRTLVNHAQAIGERRFIVTPEPGAAELKVVVRAMNALSERVRQMLADEAQRLEHLRRQVQEDALTGLLERRQFLNALAARLADPDAPARGALLILRICRLNEVNRDLGRTGADQLLRALARTLEGDPDAVAGRLNGSDFALLAPPAADIEPWARATAARLHDVAGRHADAAPLALPVAAVLYGQDDTVANILARLDTALAEAELEGGRALRIDTLGETAAPRTQEQWRDILTAALAENGFHLGTTPVRALQGKNRLIHNEAPVDLLAAGVTIKSGDFLPWAARFGLTGRLGLAAIRAALERIHAGDKPVALTISALAFQDGHFVTELIALLRASPRLARRLWLEVPEDGIARDPGAFHAFCLAIKPLASKLGIKHAGPRFSALGDLHDLGLDYIKIDASLLHDIDGNEGNQSFVRSLAMLAHALGLTVIAEGIDRPEQQETLVDLGFDAIRDQGSEFLHDS